MKIVHDGISWHVRRKMRKGGGSGTLDQREYVTFAGRNLRQ